MVKFEPGLELESLLNCEGAQQDIVLSYIGCAFGERSKVEFFAIHQHLALHGKATSATGYSSSHDWEQRGLTCTGLSHDGKELPAFDLAVEVTEYTFVGFVMH